ncbi:MAG TPA: hypothetical protein PKC43_01710 [Phycisphaerales bacterium]|nr:hypothetical protein [Phycisphaerales bacterium]
MRATHAAAARLCALLAALGAVDVRSATTAGARAPAADGTPTAPLDERRADAEGPPTARPAAPAPRPAPARTVEAPDDPEWLAVREEAINELRAELLPLPITAAQIDLWGVLCDLDPDHFEALRGLHAEYMRRLDGVLEREGRQQALLAVAYEWDPGTLRLRPSYTPIQLDALELRDAMVTRMAPAEEDLVAAFVALVPPESVATARQLAFRRHFRLHALPTVRRSAAVDLVTILDAAELGPEERALVSGIVDDYIRKMTAAARWRFGEASRIEREHTALLVELGPLWESVVEPEERVAIDDRLADLRARRLRAELPISGINRETLLRLVRSLPPAAAARVESAFWHRVRPELFDDERAFAALIRDSLDLARSAGRRPGAAPGAGEAGEPTPALDESERSGRDLLYASTRVRLLSLGFAAADVADEIAAIVELGPPSDDRRRASERVAAELRRLDLMRQRRTICADAARALAATLRAEETLLRDRIAGYLTVLALRGEADDWLTAQYGARSAELDRLALRPPREMDDRRGRPDSEDDGADPAP